MRFGKGGRGRGSKSMLVPAINSTGALLDWWMVDVRHQFGEDVTRTDVPLLPSERRFDERTDLCRRTGTRCCATG
ncbi:hypothetical protein Lfu02_77350 [Longispora fulva]|nr:hypothetical protein Lfu02_77350 [Longispora fulva]